MNHSSKKSGLIENDGIILPRAISEKSVSYVQGFRKIQPTADELVKTILEGNKIALSRAITLIESTNSDHLQKANLVIQGCLPFANKSVRIGITGVPGVGKSTFIEVFGKYLTSIGKKVAVLAVDPSSSISHGSILGDKTRMEELVKDDNAYIRPSPSGETLGGVARKTRETIILCEACGFDIILIETVGVGQSEIAVNSMVDFFLLLSVAGTGDELQGIKRGIMEMADLIAINKDDGDNINKVKLMRLELHRALHLFPEKDSGWISKIVTCSSIEKKGVDEIWKIIEEYFILTQSNGYLEKKRTSQNQYWFLEEIDEQLRNHFYNNQEVIKLLELNKKAVQDGEISPFAAAQLLLKKYFTDFNCL